MDRRGSIPCEADRFMLQSSVRETGPGYRHRMNRQPVYPVPAENGAEGKEERK